MHHISKSIALIDHLDIYISYPSFQCYLKVKRDDLDYLSDDN